MKSVDNFKHHLTLKVTQKKQKKISNNNYKAGMLVEFQSHLVDNVNRILYEHTIISYTKFHFVSAVVQTTEGRNAENYFFWFSEEALKRKISQNTEVEFSAITKLNLYIVYWII